MYRGKWPVVVMRDMVSVTWKENELRGILGANIFEAEQSMLPRKQAVMIIYCIYS